MAKAKVVLLTPPGVEKRNAVNMGRAPSDFEVIWVDNNLSVEEKIPLCKDAVAIIVSPAVVSVELLKHCPKVRLIQTTGAGYNQLDVKAILEMGIPIANSGGTNAIPVAEQTIALMISVCKRMMDQWRSAFQERRWRGDLSSVDLVEVSNKTVGIVGLGRIGKQVAKRLKGFDTNTIYYDILEMPLEIQQELNAHPVSFEELLRESDIVTLHIPLTADTRAIIGERELDLMKPTAFLINISRGPVVDEKAVYQALRNRRIAAAGLDVLEVEPAAPDNPLFELDNVVITPHMGGLSYETDIRAADFAYSNIKRALAGEPIESLVTVY